MLCSHSDRNNEHPINMGLLALWLQPRPPNEMPTLFLASLMRPRPASACAQGAQKRVQATNRAQSCRKASAHTHSGLRFGPKMCWSGQSAHPLARPSCPPRDQPTEARSHFPFPPLCFPAVRAPPPFRRRRHHAHRRCPLATPTAKKKPLLPSHPDATLGRRRPPVDGHNRVG
jgi:hypothetical protein